MKRVKETQRKRQARIKSKRITREKSRKIKRFARRLHRDYLLAERRSYAAHHEVIFDKNLARAQIILPKNFSCWDNYYETVRTIHEMRQAALTERRQIMVHLQHIEHIEPAAALLLVSEIFRIRNLRGFRAVHGTYPERRIIYDQLSEMGFFQLLDISEAFGRPSPNSDISRPIFLRFLSDNRFPAENVNSFVSIIEKHLFPMNAVARGKLVGAIKEAMSNTLDHAHPDSARIDGITMPNRWWMSSWVNLEASEVTIMFFDQGVGIPGTLTPDIYQRIKATLANLVQFKALAATPTDGTMIMAATELHRTGTGQSGRGRGFRDMKRFVDVCDDGELRILSNHGRYSYIRGQERCADESLSLGGTMIEWRFRHVGSVEMNDE